MFLLFEQSKCGIQRQTTELRIKEKKWAYQCLQNSLLFCFALQFFLLFIQLFLFRSVIFAVDALFIYTRFLVGFANQLLFSRHLRVYVNQGVCSFEYIIHSGIELAYYLTPDSHGHKKKERKGN